MQSHEDHTRAMKKAFWTEATVGIGYELEAGNVMRRVYGDRMAEIQRLAPDFLPPAFFEVGPGIDPSITQGVSVLLPHNKIDVYFSDYTYSDQYNRFLASSAIALGCIPDAKNQPLFRTDSDISHFTSRQLEQNASLYLEHNGITMHYSDQGLPGRTVPPHIERYNLAFASIANYVDKKDLLPLISDPRVTTVMFINSRSAGYPELAHQFDPNRVESTLDISAACKTNGFLLCDSIMDIRKSGGVVTLPPDATLEEIARTEGSRSSPTIAQLWIKPGDNIPLRNWIMAKPKPQILS
jgi:hypothetical protein